MRCRYPGCLNEVIRRAGPGRPPIYCPDHRNKSSSRRAVRFATLVACCVDARLANPRVRTCEQHKQWRQFVKDARRSYGGSESEMREYDRLLEAWGSVPDEPRGWRISYNDTYIIESVKDRKQHKIADQFIRTKAGTYKGDNVSPGDDVGGQDGKAA